jgi:hypothetical protein
VSSLQAGLEALNDQERAHQARCQARCQALREWCEAGFAVRGDDGYVVGDLRPGEYQGTHSVALNSSLFSNQEEAEAHFRELWDEERRLAQENGAQLLVWRVAPRARSRVDQRSGETRYWIGARAFFCLPVEGECDE